MSILIDKDTRIIVQGITGRTGGFASRYMVEYGSRVLAGVSPGKGGLKVWGIPVYDRVSDVFRVEGDIDASLIIVPPESVLDAAIEALREGVRLLCIPTENVPIHDAMRIIAYARRSNARVIGPGSFGVISPGKSVLGWIGGSIELAREAFKPGIIGIVSRSGGQTTTISWMISRAGYGVSTAIHVGSEPIIGTTMAEALELFEGDDETRAVVLFGEIGGVQEEEAAEFIMDGGFTKPLIAYIAGRRLPSGIRFSHASAIIEAGRGSPESKIRALKDAGAHIIDNPSHLPIILKKVLG